MPILSYTTSVAVDKTVAELQKSLALFGVSRLMVEYGRDRVPSGMQFAYETRFGQRFFRLPANVDGVERVLRKQASAKRNPMPKRYAERDQAARVAWRILLTWVRAQLAIVEAEVVTIDEVMLPYMLAADDKTFYEKIVETQLALPGPSR
jgi:hypothetical protein